MLQEPKKVVFLIQPGCTNDELQRLFNILLGFCLYGATALFFDSEEVPQKLSGADAVICFGDWGFFADKIPSSVKTVLGLYTKELLPSSLGGSFRLRLLSAYNTEHDRSFYGWVLQKALSDLWE